MYKPNPVVCDGNLILSACTAAILNNMPKRDVIFNSDNENVMYRGRGIVVKAFLVSIFSQVKAMKNRGLSPTNFSIVWDKRISGNYHKSTILNELDDDKGYKGDRKYASMDDLNNPDLTEEEKQDIEASIIINKERMEARNILKEELPKYGIASYMVAGFEADDLDYIWGLETEKRGGQHIHYSGDSDWQFHLVGNDVAWQVNRGKLNYKDVEIVRLKHKIPEDMELMDWAELQFSAFGSHNFLQKTFDPTVKRVTKKYKDKFFSGDFSDIVDKERFEAQRKCFRILDFPGVDKVQELYKTMISHTRSTDLDDFNDLLVKLSIGDKAKYGLMNSFKTFHKILLDSKLEQL